MTKRPLVAILLASFFALSTCILVVGGLALLLPGSKLDVIWNLYPARRAMLIPYRLWVGPAFLALAAAMASASAGCFLLQRWGWGLAIAIFAANALGDAVQLLMGHVAEGVVGVTAAGAILLYLTRPAVPAIFVPHIPDQ